MRLLVVLLLFLQSQVASASCWVGESISETHKSRDSIYVTSILKVQIVTRAPRHNQVVDYIVHLRVLETVKGRKNLGISAKASKTYHDPEEEIQLIRTSEPNLSPGTRYVVFMNDDETPEISCSSTVRYATEHVLAEIRLLTK